MNFAYRADIDGLRAIAILLVIFNHIGLSIFPGGYIGVDIFFVISGYLITLILSKEIQNQTFSIGRFYKKRVVRLAPAYFTALSVVSLVAWQVMLPDELSRYFDSVFYATFLMANIYMQREVGDYFSQSVNEVPLLHLWSLGVEEQFYIFWPLILLCFIKKSNRQWGLLMVGSFILMSLLYAQQQLSVNAEKAYYSMPVRAFELLLGALICFLPQMKWSKWLAQTLVWGCLALLLGTAMWFDHATPFPGAMALIPCLATALIIYIGQSVQSQNVVLTNRFSLWMGKISYPLYLWHWPVIVLFSIYMLPVNAGYQLAMVLLSIALAYLTYRYIEQPSKSFVMAANYKVILSGFVAPALCFIGVAQLVSQHQGFPERLSPQVQNQMAALNSFAHGIRQKCHSFPNPETLANPKDCVLGVEKPQIDFMLIGDSHANSYTGLLDVWAKDAGLRGYDSTQDTTIYLPGVQRGRGEHEVAAFQARNDAIEAHLKQHHYQFVVMSAAFSQYLDAGHDLHPSAEEGSQVANHLDSYFAGLQAAVDSALASSEHVVMLMDVPVIDPDQANCSLRREWLGIERECAVSAEEFQQSNAPIYQWMSELQQQYPQLIVVEPTKVLCDAQQCDLSVEGTPLYRNQDDDHLSFKGSEALGQAYLQQYGNPLKSL